MVTVWPRMRRASHKGRRTVRRTPAQRRVGWTHALSYKGLSPAAFAHRSRLARLHMLIRGTRLPVEGLLVDLGCSDGFIIEQLWRHGDLPAGWRFAGYDHAARLLEAARLRGVPNTEFHLIDLNDPDARALDPGDLVLCLETLEHLGDYRSGLHVIDASTRPGGRIVLSMPNEVGLVGLVKFVGRPLLRAQPYRGFFSSREEVFRYLAAVVSGREIAGFRSPPRSMWAAHLGFDHRIVSRYITERYVHTGRWKVEVTTSSMAGSNRFLVLARQP